MIPNRPPPHLHSGSKWSTLFSDFISHCLVKDPQKRSSAHELLQVSFTVYIMRIASFYSRCCK